VRPVRLIVGLGNPGREYADSRHNIGFQCLTLFARRHGIPIIERRLRSRIGRGEVGGQSVILAKPHTYMNRSGEAVRALLRHFQLSAPDLLVIYDDLDLPVGKIRLRPRGSAGGHNGVKSIIACLGTEDFPRLRVGIAPEAGDQDGYIRTPGFVLSSFSPQERALITEVRQRVADAVYCVLAEGLEAAMNRYN